MNTGLSTAKSMAAFLSVAPSITARPVEDNQVTFVMSLFVSRTSTGLYVVEHPAIIIAMLDKINCDKVFK